MSVSPRTPLCRRRRSCSSPAWTPSRRGRAWRVQAHRRPGCRCSGWPCRPPQCRRRPASTLPSSAICQTTPASSKHPAGVGHHLGGGVGGTGLAPAAGILAQAHAVVHPSAVALLVHLGKVGVIGRRRRRRRGRRTAPEQARRGTPWLSHRSLDEGVEGSRLHTGDALGADLLLVRQRCTQRCGGGRRQVQQGLQGGVAAHPVIVAVGADEGAVQSRCRMALKAGTASSSAEMKSASVMPYFWLSSSMTGQLHPVAHPRHP